MYGPSASDRWPLDEEAITPISFIYPANNKYHLNRPVAQTNTKYTTQQSI